MRSLSRREFLGTGAATLALAGCGGASGSGRNLSVMLGGAQSLDEAPIFLALSTGLFARQRLHVKLLTATIGSQALQQVIAGNAAIARATTLPAVTAIANQKAPLVVIGNDAQESSDAVVSLGQRPIRSVRELVGKTVGVQTLMGGNAQVLDVQLHRVGIPQSAVKRVVVGSSASAVAFLQDHRADAILVSIDKLAIIAKSNPSIVSFNLTGPGPVFGVSYVVTRETLSSRRPELVSFVRALLSAMRQLVDPSTRSAALQKLSGAGFTALGDPVTARKAMENVVDAWLAAGPSNLLRNVPAGWASDVQALISAGVLKPGADPAAMYTNSLIDAAGG